MKNEFSIPPLFFKRFLILLNISMCEAFVVKLPHFIHVFVYAGKHCNNVVLKDNV